MHGLKRQTTTSEHGLMEDCSIREVAACCALRKRLHGNASGIDSAEGCSKQPSQRFGKDEGSIFSMHT